MSSVKTAPPSLPVVLRAPLFVVAGLSAVVVVVLGVLFAGGSVPRWFDGALLPSVEGIPDPWWYFARVIDFCGEPVGSVVLLLVVVVGCLVLGRARTAVLSLVGVGLTVGVTTLLKPVVGRTIHGEFLSFPSGHTAMATALAVALALAVADRFGRVVGVLLVLGVALVAGVTMGWAQVGLGAHYPTDALGGFCTALAVVPFAAWGVDYVFGRG